MKPFQKALITGLAAIASVSASYAQDTLGTINKVNFVAVQETPGTPIPLNTNTNNLSERLTSNKVRLSVKTILTALAADGESGFPTDAGITGWSIVEVFTQGSDETPGESQGFFAYKKGFTPVPISDTYLSLVVPAYADSFESDHLTSVQGDTPVRADHTYKAPSTGTAVSNIVFTGATVSRTSIKLVGPLGGATPHSVTSRSTSFTGGEATYSVSGSIVSTSSVNLTNIQPFLDASGATPPAAE